MGLTGIFWFIWHLDIKNLSAAEGRSLQDFDCGVKCIIVT
jgi:hypothetical protein